MSWDFVASASGQETDSGENVWGTSTSLDLNDGDLVVAWVKWDGTTTSCSVTDGTNSLDMESVTEANGDCCGVFGYKINCSNNDSSTFEATVTARAWKALLVMQFRPDDGETVTLDQSSTAATGYGTAPSSNNIDPEGTDIVVVAAVAHDGGNSSGHTINETADEGIVTITGNASEWYYRYTTEQSSMDADCTLDGSADWVCDIISFKSESSGIWTTQTDTRIVFS
jgi:hypothetical protein